MKYDHNILIFRLSSMGDVILTSSLIRQVRKKFPKSRIDFVVAEQFSEIFKYNPHISNLYKSAAHAGKFETCFA